MLEQRDLEQIGNLLDTKLNATFEKQENRLNAKIDEKFIEQDKRLEVKLEEKFIEQEKKIIHAVGEMLEENVFPQFAEIHSELRKLKTIAGWQT